LKVYRTGRIYLIFQSLLFVSVIIFFITKLAVGFDKIVIFIFVFLIAVLFYLLLSFVFNKVEIDRGILKKSWFFRKKVFNINEIEDVSLVKLKGRFLLILYSKNAFFFITSMFEDFVEIIEYLNQYLPLEKNVHIPSEDLRKAKKMFLSFYIAIIVLMNVFSVINVCRLN
jgi:hypothetical protein